VSEKVTAGHLSRNAIVYVRQSSARQVTHNRESQRLQYAMRERVTSFGWRDVEVIDDDLGVSASGIAERKGFQRLIAKVSLGQVGAVAARELSRFARNSRDWQQLIEVCRYVDTLLIDEESIYDARLSNDRLLLGLKGSMNEYELDLLRLRSLEARREKARRGEYYARVPVGYLKAETDELEKHPDQRIRHVIELIFEKFLELGSVRQTHLWLREHDIDIPRNKTNRGDVVWKQASYGHLIEILKNQTYAGSYVYGKTATRTRLNDSKIERVVVHKPREEWLLISDHHEGYIDIKTHERIQDMISRNAQSRSRSSAGAAKTGSALLAGLVRCRRCGQKLTVSYSGSQRSIRRYTCNRANTEHGDPVCISFSGIDVDKRVAAEVLDVVQPAALDASMQAAAQCAASQDELLETLRIELEAATYASDRAWRQFDQADPANRLVVDELERRWNQALERVRELEQRIANAEHERTNAQLPDRSAFEELAADLQRVWNAPNVDVRLKKRIMRTLIEEIVADITEDGAEIVLVVHWKGGAHTELRVPKRRRGHTSNRTPADVVEAIRVLALVCDDATIAQWLSRNGIRTAQDKQWSRALITSLRHRYGVPCYVKEEQPRWLTLAKAAKHAGVAWKTMERIISRGELDALHPLPRGPWLIDRDDLGKPEMVKRLEQCRARRTCNPDVPASGQLMLGIPKT